MDNNTEVKNIFVDKRNWLILLAIVFFPFSLTWWVWKQNWNITIKLGTIVVFWLIILVAFASNSRYKAGYEAGQQATIKESLVINITITPIPPTLTLIPPTLTPESTLISIINPSPTAIVGSYMNYNTLSPKDIPEAVHRYTSSMVALFNERTKSSNSLATNMGSWPNFTDTQIITMAADTVILEKLYDEAFLIVAPSEISSIHEKYLMSFKLLKEAMPLLRSALDNRDDNLMTKASEKIHQSKLLLDEANSEVKAMSK